MTTQRERAQRVWEYFAQISAIPRPSRKEERIRQWLIAWAEEHKFQQHVDRAGNVIVYAPAIGDSARPMIALQTHMDMVCEKHPDYTHDFTRDPIRYYADGDWLKAEGTTLGADDGIGMALVLTLATDTSISRPPLELLFTVDEETGLTGAAKLDGQSIRSRYLVNIDSEDDASLIVGCAGGINIHVSFTHGGRRQRRALSADMAMARITLGGYRGGHSGVDIANPVGNAIRDLCALMLRLSDALPDSHIDIAGITGGTVHNAIPREATATIVYARSHGERIAHHVLHEQQEMRAHYASTDTTPVISIDDNTGSTCDADRPVMHDSKTMRRILTTVCALPNGVITLVDNSTIPLLSLNAATMRIDNKHSEMLLSLRSLHRDALDTLRVEIAATVSSAGFRATAHDAYPPWEPNFDSSLLRQAVASYEQALGASPRVEVIHAGLEPAVIAEKYPSLEMISCGPLMLHPHSPDERLSISSTERIYTFLRAFLHGWHAKN